MPKKILCYGDSNTYGYDPETGGRYPAKDRWPEILATYLPAGWTVFNAGQNGRTTAYDFYSGVADNGLARLPHTLAQNLPIDMVIFMLGTNDCAVQLGLTLEEIAGGMERLVDLARAVCLEKQGFAPAIVVVSPAPIRSGFERSPFAFQLSEQSVQRSRQLAPAYEMLAKDKACLFVDGSNCEVSTYDCEHLTTNGHMMMAEIIYKSLCSGLI